MIYIISLCDKFRVYISILTPSQVYKKIGTLSRELLKLKSDVISKKHEIENSSKIDFSLINDNSSHKNDQLTKLRERIKSSKDNKFLENLMQELNFSIISYKTERANLLSEITLILDALNYYLDIFNKIEGNITSCEDSLSEFTLNLDFSNLEN